MMEILNIPRKILINVFSRFTSESWESFLSGTIAILIAREVTFFKTRLRTKAPTRISRIIEAPQFLRVNDFADSAVVIKILGETQPIDQWAVTGELRKRIKIAFDEAGIEFPFPQMVVHQAK